MSRQTTTRRRHGVRRMSERKRLTITAISAVLALVTVVICALSGVFNFHKGNERILPNLVGQTEESAKAQLAELDAGGFGRLPVCIAKTQYSFSTDPKRMGAADGFELQVNDVIVNSGAEMIVVVAGDILRMPGLPKKPMALNIRIKDGLIEGLS